MTNPVNVLDSLTPEQEELCKDVFNEYDSFLDRLPNEPNMDHIKNWLTIVYKMYETPMPNRIEVVGSPFEAFRLEKELTGKTERSLDWCGILDAGWVMFYDYFNRIGILSDAESHDVLALREFQRSIWDTILLDECAICVALPALLKRDRDGNLHNESGPCIQWKSGEKDFAWHGLWVPEKVIMDPRGYTREEYDAISNTEVRRALGEHAGWDFIVGLLKASCVNTWTDPKTNLRYELWNSGNQNWIKKQSPVLQAGDQPDYFEPVHENLKTAQAARKWQAVPQLSPEDCEKNPVLVYGVET